MSPSGAAPNRGFNLDDYVTVAERVANFYAQFPEGSLQAEIVELSDSRVVVRAYAYRNHEDPRPGIAHSMLGIPGSSPYTRGSELENAETSAVGRAIAFLGFDVKRSIASADEVRAKQVEAKVETTNDGGLIGTVEVGKQQTSDFVLRTDATRGPTIGFRLRGEKGGILVRAFGALADQMDESRELLVGKRITAWGRVGDETIPAKDNKPAITYQVLTADRVSVPGLGMLPVDTTPEASGPPDGPGELTEQESEALWAEMDRIRA